MGVDSNSVLDVAQAWNEAVNTRDTARLLQLSDPKIELVGPRGAARGHAVLADWLGQTGLRLETRRRFAAGDVVVHAQQGRWLDAQTSEVVGEGPVYTVYRVRAGRVAFVSRHDDLAAALLQAGLSEADEVR